MRHDVTYMWILKIKTHIMGERRGTCTKDPWAKTMGWGLSLGAGLDRAGESNGEERDGDNCN